MKHHNLYYCKIVLAIAILLIGCLNNAERSDLTVTTTNVPSTEKIAFVYDRDGKTDVIVMDVNGSNQKNLTEDLVGSLKPVWSPDGQYITFTSNRNGVTQIFTMKSDGSNQRQLTHDQSGADNPEWSPDGQYIIFISYQDMVLSDEGVQISEIYIMKSDGSEQRRLTNNQDFERDLSWSPTGNVIAVSSNIRSSTGITFPEQIYLMDLDGKTQKQLTEFDSYNEHPVWSPDGKFIVFSSYGNGESSIYVMKADGSDKTLLIKSTNSASPFLYVNYITPSWSPDGQYIIFSSNRDGDYDLYTIKVDGTDLMKLTNIPGDEKSPVWSAGK